MYVSMCLFAHSFGIHPLIGFIRAFPGEMKSVGQLTIGNLLFSDMFLVGILVSTLYVIEHLPFNVKFD